MASTVARLTGVTGAVVVENGKPDSACRDGEIRYAPPRGATKGCLGRFNVAVTFSGSIPVVNLDAPGPSCPI